MRIRPVVLLYLISGLNYAAAPINGWYSEIFGGYTYIAGNINTTYTGYTFNRSAYNSGYNGGGRIGFKDYPMRYEGEISYLTAFPSQYYVDNVRQTGYSGMTSATAALANVYFDFPEIIITLTPYLSGGIGYAYLSTNLTSTGPTTTYQFRNSGSVFAYQGSAGLSYNFANNYSLDVAYRYLGTTTSGMGVPFQAHMAIAGATYRFDGENYK
ncbi:MAG: hypothetical protein A3F18_05380 [Legionellales bacterium RIFCSPHIGHO2_12_FULL_37_14]|nr:MAG: hypothetical protein A3F18_05380 [Legionellales bacterium RIFCSPHIGHO2_12_FULL_37_14]